jgi:hypothetical protein
MLDTLAGSDALNGPAVTKEELKDISSSTTGKLVLGGLGTYLLIRFASAPGTRLAPQRPSNTRSRNGSSKATYGRA